MKTEKKTRVSFSEGDVKVSLPRGWHELTEGELAEVYRLAAKYDTATLPVMVFRHLTGMRVHREVDGKWLVSFPVTNRVRRRCLLSDSAIGSAVSSLGWLRQAGNIPVRLRSMRKGVAVDAQLHGVEFGVWLQVENYYQSYLNALSPEPLHGIATLLYPGFSGGELSIHEQMNILNWVTQIKSLFAEQFRNLFSGDGTGGSSQSMLEIMNNEIRILSGGDVTKEDVVLSCDCWRALTELDYKAKEAQDLNREIEKSRNGRK